MLHQSLQPDFLATAKLRPCPQSPQEETPRPSFSNSRTQAAAFAVVLPGELPGTFFAAPLHLTDAEPHTHVLPATVLA